MPVFGKLSLLKEFNISRRKTLVVVKSLISAVEKDSQAVREVIQEMVHQWMEDIEKRELQRIQAQFCEGNHIPVTF